MERLIVVNNSLFSYNPIIDLFLFTRQKTARLCSWDEWRGIKLSRHFGRAVVYLPARRPRGSARGMNGGESNYRGTLGAR